MTKDEAEADAADARAQEQRAHDKQLKEYWRGRHDAGERLVLKILEYLDEEDTK